MKKTTLKAISAILCLNLISGIVPVSSAADTDNILKGDINEDKAVTATDLVILEKYILAGENIEQTALQRADINDDGTVNIVDIILLKNMLLNGENITTPPEVTTSVSAVTTVPEITTTIPEVTTTVPEVTTTVPEVTTTVPEVTTTVPEVTTTVPEVTTTVPEVTTRSVTTLPATTLPVTTVPVTTVPVPTVPVTTPHVTEPVQLKNVTEEELKAIKYINEWRASNNLKTLEVHDTLCACADIRIQELKESFNSKRPDGSNVTTLFEEMGAPGVYNYYQFSCSAQTTPEEFIDYFVSYQSTNTNTSSKKNTYKYIGIGYSDGYWNVLFAS